MLQYSEFSKGPAIHWMCVNVPIGGRQRDRMNCLNVRLLKVVDSQLQHIQVRAPRSGGTCCF